MDALMQIAVCPKVRNHNYLFGLSAYHPYSVILNFEHLCSLKNFCEEIKVILRFNTLIEGRNRQFEANFLPYLFKKEWLRDWALNACEVNPVSFSQSSQSVIAEITGWRHRLLGPVSHKARFLPREPGFWSLVKNRDWAQVPFYCLFLHVICFYFLKRKILAVGYSTLNAAFD